MTLSSELVADALAFLVQEMLRLRDLIDDLNAGIYNPVGLNILWPRNVAFLYVCCPNFFQVFDSDRTNCLLCATYFFRAVVMPRPRATCRCE